MTIIVVGLVVCAIGLVLIYTCARFNTGGPTAPYIFAILVILGMFTIIFGSRTLVKGELSTKSFTSPKSQQAQAEPATTAPVASNEVITVRVGVSGLTLSGTLPKPTNNMQSR